jgi:extradiol dioxygenase family protein
LVIHYKPKTEEALHTNAVDGKNVPVPHYGVVLPWETFESFSAELQEKGIEFVIEPYIRFEGEVGEQATLFFLDPAGKALEFKAFRNIDQLFAK